jgi:hypothetical protein
MKLLVLSSLLTALTFSVSCTTKVEGLYIKDDFKAPAVKSGKILTGGVVAEPGKFSLQKSNDYSNVMLAAFKDERKYIPLIPYSRFFNGVGEAQFTKIMQQYSKADLDEKTLSEVVAALKGVRYLALAKVDSNITTTGESETDAKEYKNEKGEKVRQPGKVTKTHTREIAATLHIYDLKAKAVAFTGQVKKSRENRAEYEKNIVKSVVSIVNAVKGKDRSATYPTPPAPADRDVLRDVFEGFAENLPKKD